jgi:translation initiation factor 3 subunit B
LQEAQTAREQTNGYKLDRSHVFVVNMFDDFDKYMKVPDEWVPPEIKPYTPGVIFSYCATIGLTCSKHS